MRAKLYESIDHANTFHGKNEVCIVNVEGPSSPSKDAPAAILERHVPGCLRIVPAVLDEETGRYVREVEKAWTASGTFAETGDSRLGDKCRALLGHHFYGAVAIHDRLYEYHGD